MVIQMNCQAMAWAAHFYVSSVLTPSKVLDRLIFAGKPSAQS
jgi:hypothetical protein